ncbi:hypothetical protein NECAME_01860 [Necator americanus]|uniref:Uncharacterized protein n=1 Tax=Necator americanus TaxID=51031 RepID=W2TPJ8_NECAM|nr:hypothetical protein NECAME_01860 [Necator americanus]ETN83061.1 hypothetical protein NECAME_01860 [Necator americanus]
MAPFLSQMKKGFISDTSAPKSQSNSCGIDGGVFCSGTRAPLTITKDSLRHVLYKKRPETAHIDCGRILRGDKFCHPYIAVH